MFAKASLLAVAGSRCNRVFCCILLPLAQQERMDSVIESIRETVRQRGITEEDVAAEVAAVCAERVQRRS